MASLGRPNALKHALKKAAQAMGAGLSARSETKRKDSSERVKARAKIRYLTRRNNQQARDPALRGTRAAGKTPYGTKGTQGMVIA